MAEKQGLSGRERRPCCRFVFLFFFKENLDPLNSFEQGSNMIRTVLTDQKSECIKKRRGRGVPSISQGLQIRK